jgi:hypothetical protein
MDTQQPQTPQIQNPEPTLKIPQLRGFAFVLEILRAIGSLAGMSILWGLEIIRDKFFSVLERWNVRPRRKHASAFPPGRPKQKTAA